MTEAQAVVVALTITPTTAVGFLPETDKSYPGCRATNAESTVCADASLSSRRFRMISPAGPHPDSEDKDELTMEKSGTAR